MHSEILSVKQQELLTFITQFKRNFYLVGGTAVALYIGHRRSIDFDLFSFSKLNRLKIKYSISKSGYKQSLIAEDIDQIHFILNEVKITFFNYPFPVPHKEQLNSIISMPSLLSLAAMKAFALGRRAKWKDYIDLYFIIRDFYTVQDISKEAETIFGQMFSEKLFREQLAYHKDIDYCEEVEFMGSFAINERDIKEFLIDKALQQNYL